MARSNPLSELCTHEKRLANGLTVLVREDHSAPVVAIVTHVRAGYFDEPDKLIGISHVLEHMYFKGTERRDAGEIARETKAAGGYLNAGTIYDHTSYYTVLPSSALEQGIDIQADALQNSAIDDDELRRELRVIIQEAKRKLDNAPAFAQESLFETMFDVHRIRRWRIGTEEVLESLTREDVWSYYRNLYRPSNVTLVIAGDVEPERVFELAERHYGGMPSGEPVRDTAPEEPERSGFRFRELSGDIVHSYIEWGWRTQDPLHEDTPTLDLLATVLGVGRASRLFRSVRERGLVNTIGAYNYTLPSVGVFGVNAEANPPQVRGALRAIARTIEAVRNEEVREVELERARNIVEARMLRRLETVEGQANLIAEWQALGDWRLAASYLDRLLATEAPAVRAVAERYLAPERTTVLVYRPDQASPIESTPDELANELFGRADGRPRPRPRPSEDGVHLYDFDNGVTLVVKPRPTSALATTAVALRGGSVAEPAGEAGVTALMARTSVKGTETRTGAQLAEEVETLGGSISPAPGADLIQWSVAVPRHHFARSLELLADAVVAPIFPAEELERERAVALSDLEQLRDDMMRYPLRLLLSAAFAGHPYGNSIETVEAGLRSLSRDDAVRWHAERILSGRAWVIVAGAVDPDTVVREVSERFAPVHGLEEPTLPVARWPDSAVTTTAEREKAQTAIALGFPGVSRNDPDFLALQLLSAAISGLGGSLFEELRSRRSLAYSVTAYPIGRLLGGAFVAYIGTSPEREEEARETLLSELLRWTRETLPDDELQRAKRYTIGSWQIRNQTNSGQVNELTSALLLGKGLEEIREFEHRIGAITAEQIRDAAARSFDSARFVTAVVRGSGKSR